MSEPMNATPELLIAAGVRTDAHSQDLFASHARADAAVDSALFGWVGQSAAALSATASMWASATTDLSIRVYAHGEALRLTGVQFAEMEHRNAQTAAQVHRDAGSQ